MRHQPKLAGAAPGHDLNDDQKLTRPLLAIYGLAGLIVIGEGSLWPTIISVSRGPGMSPNTEAAALISSFSNGIPAAVNLFLTSAVRRLSAVGLGYSGPTILIPQCRRLRYPLACIFTSHLASMKTLAICMVKYNDSGSFGAYAKKIFLGIDSGISNSLLYNKCAASSRNCLHAVRRSISAVLSRAAAASFSRAAVCRRASAISAFAFAISACALPSSALAFAVSASNPTMRSCDLSLAASQWCSLTFDSRITENVASAPIAKEQKSTRLAKSDQNVAVARDIPSKGHILFDLFFWVCVCLTASSSSVAIWFQAKTVMCSWRRARDQQG
jgi:hypothetical protein